MGCARLGADGDEAETGHHHQPLLRATDRDIHPPVVHGERHGRQRGHRIDHQQRRMAGGVDGGADGGDVVDHARGGIHLGHQHRLDGGAGIATQPRLQCRRIDGAPPVAAQCLDAKPDRARHLPPGGGETAALQHQHRIARRQHVDQRRLPGAVAVGDVDVASPGGAEDAAQVGEQAGGQRQQIGGIDVDRRAVHGAEHLVRHRGRPRNAEKFAPAAKRHRLSLPFENPAPYSALADSEAGKIERRRTPVTPSRR